MARRTTTTQPEVEAVPVEAPVAKYAPRPYADAVTPEHAEFLRGLGVEIE